MVIVLKDEAYAIIGACFEVYNDKGPGFLEPVYQECLEIEFEIRRIPFKAHEEMTDHELDESHEWERDSE